MSNLDGSDLDIDVGVDVDSDAGADSDDSYNGVCLLTQKAECGATMRKAAKKKKTLAKKMRNLNSRDIKDMK